MCLLTRTRQALDSTGSPSKSLFQHTSLFCWVTLRLALTICTGDILLYYFSYSPTRDRSSKGSIGCLGPGEPKRSGGTRTERVSIHGLVSPSQIDKVIRLVGLEQKHPCFLPLKLTSNASLDCLHWTCNPMCSLRIASHLASVL